MLSREGRWLDLTSARSFLFVPGSHPQRFERAQASGADVVVVDLEDAVAANDKLEARDAARRWLAAGNRAAVRVNAHGSAWHASDLDAVADLALAVMLPKAEPEQVHAVAEAFKDRPVALIPLIETAKGLRHAEEICAHRAVVRPAIGTVDLAAELGVDPATSTLLDHARGVVAFAAAAAACGTPIDGVTTDIRDVHSLDREIGRARSLGFTAKLAIHPAQVNPINRAFVPSDQEMEWATRILAGPRRDGVDVIDGQMIDEPVRRRARMLLARACTSGSPG
jgi:citrate lyase subunit beta/citryl-CoA lyase